MVTGKISKSQAARKRNPNPKKTGKPKGWLPKTLTTPENRKRKSPICGAKRTGKSTSGPGICCSPAGWGTDHPGFGRCKNHGGNAPGVIDHQATKKEMEAASKAVRLYGLPKDVDPHQALAELVQRTAGHVAWLGEFISQFDDPSKLKQMTDTGVRPAVWVEMYQEERKLLERVSASAIKAGVAERKVRMDEQLGRLIAGVIQKFLANPALNLTPQQQALAPTAMREALGKAMPAEPEKETITIEDAEWEPVQ